jgi:precorrin-6B methylase 2
MRLSAIWQHLVCVMLVLRAAVVSAAMFDGKPPPFIVTPMTVVDRMMALAKVGPGDTVMDLGSGDGRIVIHAARQYHAHGIGVEMIPDLVATSRRNAENAGVADKVRFIQQDALAADLSAASVLTLYLEPELNVEIMPRILSQMRPGARVVSHDFGIGSWPPDAVERFAVPEKNDGRGGESSIFLWIVPANAMGRWRATFGAEPSLPAIELSIGQEFQRIEGVVHLGTRKLPLRNARLSAEMISFALPPEATPLKVPLTVNARIEGHSIKGEWLQPNGRSASFQATRVAARPELF